MTICVSWVEIGGARREQQYEKKSLVEDSTQLSDFFTVYSFSDVTTVTADGIELREIRLQFSNIPMHSSDEVTWHGDLAKFIVYNLKLN